MEKFGAVDYGNSVPETIRSPATTGERLLFRTLKPFYLKMILFIMNLKSKVNDLILNSKDLARKDLYTVIELELCLPRDEIDPDIDESSEEILMEKILKRSISMSLHEKYNLNEEASNFLLEFEMGVERGTAVTNRELVKLFKESTFYNDVVRSYYKTAVSKSIWWAVKRSNKWKMERGRYTKL
ncbi:MAG: hypothetical protein WAM95_23635 [Bacillus sp. (in: firmicutes)]